MGMRLSQKIGRPVVLPVFDQDWITFPTSFAGGGSKTLSASIMKYRQRLNGIEIDFTITGNAVASGGGATNVVFSIPSGMLIDFSNLGVGSPSDANVQGYGFDYGVTANAIYNPLSAVVPLSTTTIGFLKINGGYITQALLNNTNVIQITGKVWVPIVGMSAYRLAGAGLASVNGVAEIPGMVRPRKAQFDMTVTGSGWTTTRAKSIYYQDQAGNHRLKFNIVGTVTSSSRTQCSITLSGVTFPVSAYQAVSAYVESPSTAASGLTQLNSGTINAYHASISSVFYAFGGDVELASKPSWA